MNTLKLVGGGVALVIFAAVMVPPWLKDSKQKEARDEAYQPVATSLQPLVEAYASLDLKTLPQKKSENLAGRKAMFVDWEKKQLLPLQRDLDNALVAQKSDDVGLVVYYRVIPDAQPSVKFEGGGRGFGAKLVLVAVSNPEKQVVGSLRKSYAAPSATLGVKVLGSTTSVDMIAPVPPEDVYAFVRGLTRG